MRTPWRAGRGAWITGQPTSRVVWWAGREYEALVGAFFARHLAAVAPEVILGNRDGRRAGRRADHLLNNGIMSVVESLYARLVRQALDPSPEERTRWLMTPARGVSVVQALSETCCRATRGRAAVRLLASLPPPPRGEGEPPWPVCGLVPRTSIAPSAKVAWGAGSRRGSTAASRDWPWPRCSTCR
jgi:hypothetical protein